MRTIYTILNKDFEEGDYLADVVNFFQESFLFTREGNDWVLKEDTERPRVYVTLHRGAHIRTEVELSCSGRDSLDSAQSRIRSTSKMVSTLFRSKYFLS